MEMRAIEDAVVPRLESADEQAEPDVPAGDVGQRDVDRDAAVERGPEGTQHPHRILQMLQHAGEDHGVERGQVDDVGEALGRVEIDEVHGRHPVTGDRGLGRVVRHAFDVVAELRQSMGERAGSASDVENASAPKMTRRPPHREVHALVGEVRTLAIGHAGHPRQGTGERFRPPSTTLDHPSATHRPPPRARMARGAV